MKPASQPLAGGAHLTKNAIRQGTIDLVVLKQREGIAGDGISVGKLGVKNGQTGTVKNAATKGVFGESAVMSRRNLWAACTGAKNACPASDHDAGSGDGTKWL